MKVCTLVVVSFLVQPALAGVYWQGGSLQIDGGSGADTIQISGPVDSVTVKFNGVTSGPYNCSNTGVIFPRGYGGNDTIEYLSRDTVDDEDQPQMWASGGAGQDVIKGTDKADSLSGGDDGDTMAGYGGGDIMHGDDGDDTIMSGDGIDSAYGDAGEDIYWCGDVYDNWETMEEVHLGGP